MRADTSAATARPAARRRWSRRAPAGGQPSQPDVGHPALVIEMRLQRPGAGRGQPVRPAPVVAVQRLDEPLPLKPAQGLVQGAGRQPDPRERLHVLGERVSVLGAVREARQDQGGRAPIPAEGSERVVLRTCHIRHLRSAGDPSGTETLAGSRPGTREATKARGNGSRSRHRLPAVTKCAMTTPRYAPKASRPANAAPCRCEATLSARPPISAMLQTTASRIARPGSCPFPAATRPTRT